MVKVKSGVWRSIRSTAGRSPRENFWDDDRRGERSGHLAVGWWQQSDRGQFSGSHGIWVCPTYPRQPGTTSSGIMVGSYDNVIQENLIVGNQGAGVVLGSMFGEVLAKKVYGNKLYGNYIGMQQDGQTPLRNTDGGAHMLGCRRE